MKKINKLKGVDSCPIVDPKPFPPFEHDTSNLDFHKDFFRFWCQKIQPLVYDDSLSYYEVLCKVAYELNEVIEKLNTLTDEQKKFVEKVIDLINNLIDEWNKLVDWWECVINQWESMVNQFNKWEQDFNQWKNEFNQWKEEFNQWEKEFNQWKKEFNQWKEEFDRLKNEWNDFRNEINEKIEELKNKIGDTIINLNSVPIVKNSRFNLGGSNAIDVRDLIYPEVVIRFISAIISEGFSTTTQEVTGGILLKRLQTVSANSDDFNYPWLGEQLTNNAVGAGSTQINNVSYPCTLIIPEKPTNNQQFDLVIPLGLGISGGQQLHANYYVYEGGKTLLYKTTRGFFGKEI